MTDRISLATLFDGPFKHIKRTVKSFLKPLGIGSVMQTTTTDLHKQTSLFMEGRYTVLYRARTELEALLHQIYSDMGMLEWEEMLSPIDKSLVIPTIGHSSRTSSGFDEALQCDEKPEELAIIVSESRLKKFHPLFLKSVAFMHKGASVYNEIQSSIASFQDQNVHITYNNNTVQMNIGGFVWWSVFISSIQSCKELNITKKVTRVYSIVNEHKSYLLDDISLVTADKRYFVECEGEGKVINLNFNIYLIEYGRVL